MTILRRLHDVQPIAEPSNDLLLRTLLRTDDSAADLSITWVRLEGHHQRLRTDAGTRVYVITDGAGRAQLGADAPVDLGAGDLLVIDAGTPYELWGPMTYLVINQPGFRDGDDIYESPSGG